MGQWHAEHGRRRRAGRVVVRAIEAFLEAGGKYRDIDKLKLGNALLDFGIDPLGYMSGIARLDGADADLTSELLADTLRLTHPDCHPPERQDLAHRVTQGLLALQPFVFPAPKPKPEPFPQPKQSDASSKPPRAALTKPSQVYPCPDCADTVPYFYCDACKAEWNKRQKAERDRANVKQRKWYAQRKARRGLGGKKACGVCGTDFEPKRADARFCSPACRQKAHRNAVTGSQGFSTEPLTTRNMLWREGILALLDRHSAVYLNDLLPKGRTRAQYQALCLVAAKLEAEGKVESIYFWYRIPGLKALVKPGYKIENRDNITRLKPDERLAAPAPAAARWLAPGAQP
jgi:hypothetical protein